MLLLYLSPLLGGTAIGLVLIVHALTYREARGGGALLLMVGAAMLWCLAYALEIASPALESKLFWAKIQYLGILSIAPIWLMLSAEYHGLPPRITHPNRFYTLLWLIPVVSLLLVWTNELHHLIWREIALVERGTYSLLAFDHGPTFWFIIVYSYALLVQGTVWLISTMVSTRPVNRRLASIALVGVMVPWAANLVYVSGVSAPTALDWTPFAFVLSGVLLTFSVFRYRALDLLPVAFRDVFSGMLDPVIVLDLEGHVTDANPAAQTLLRTALGAQIAAPEGLLSEVAARLAIRDDATGIEGDLTTGNGSDPRTYAWRATTLVSGRRPAGRLVTLRDVTQRRLYRDQLERVRKDLEEQCALQTAALEATNRQLQEELARRNLFEQALTESEQTYRVLFEHAGDAILLIAPDGGVQEANLEAADMLGHAREELKTLMVSDLLAPGEEIDLRPESALALGRPSREVRYMLRGDGSIFPAEINMATVLDPAGQPRYLQCIAREITERVRAELEQTRLIEELQQSQEQLRALGAHLQEVQEAERREIVSVLHDRIGQTLTGLSLSLRIAESAMGPACEPGIRVRLEDALHSVEEITRQVRDVMADLHPPVLEYGLLATLRWYSQVFSERTGIPARVVGAELEPRLPREVEAALFRMAQEALNNVARHAHASQVTITVGTVVKTVSLRIDDDGVGFDPQAPNVPNGHAHWGLMTLAQRAATIGGELTIQSAPGQGTHFKIELRRPDDAD
ncbi:MAG: histidine kinase N-terminal 7TM domain-containing protein [Anaerolineae bacterium]